MYFSPFEQFVIYNYFSFISNFLLFSGLAFLFYVLAYESIFNVQGHSTYSWRRQAFISSFSSRKEMLQPFFTSVNLFLRDILAAAGKGNQYIFPLLGTVFLYIFVLNMMSMVPYAFTVTSQIGAVFGFAMSIFIGLNIIGIIRFGTKLLGLFVPAGTPEFLLFMLPIVEVISYLARVFSLSIRLIANMTSGHALIHIFAGFAFQILFSSIYYIFPAAFLLVFALYILELAIAFLQAYVFSVLLSVYSTDVMISLSDLD